MRTVFASLALAVWVFYLILWARVLVDTTRSFARNWRPVGLTAIGLELVYAGTDPLIRPLRRLIPPLRIGGVSIDLSVVILLIAIFALQRTLLHFAY